MIVSETFREECGEPRQMVYFVDATIEAKPMVMSHWTVPEASGNFCSRGGRFGSHSSNERSDPRFDQKLTFITFFNAGVRALDIRDPFNPKEVGYFIPPISKATTARCGVIGGQQRCSNTVIQSNNAETDDRGYIYIADRSNTGLHIVELTARRARSPDCRAFNNEIRLSTAVHVNRRHKARQCRHRIVPACGPEHLVAQFGGRAAARDRNRHRRAP